MWSRLRLDIGWADLAFGIWQCLFHGKRQSVQHQLEQDWSQEAGDALATLSLRSAFDLLLSALQLPEGSEVLFSAINIPDMSLIARQHGLVPIPVPVLAPDCRVSVDDLSPLLTHKTRLIVVAQLLGNRVNLTEISTVIGSREILLVEDCAQAWFHPDWRGSAGADISLFSFGPIKTATAFGGGLCRVADPRILQSMRTIQDSYPIQRSRTFLVKLCRGAVVKVLSSRNGLRLVTAWSLALRINLDQLLGDATRGFAPGNLLSQLRHQPSAALLELLRRRIKHAPLDRIAKRICNADRIRSLLGSAPQLCPAAGCNRSDWLIPVFSERPEHLMKALRNHGFDASRRGKLQVLLSPHPGAQSSLKTSQLLLDQMVFLPNYAELPVNEVERMCNVVQLVSASHPHTDVPMLPIDSDRVSPPAAIR